MHFKSAAFYAALLTAQAAAVALPQTDEGIVIGGSDATGDQATDLIAAYEQVEAVIPDAVAAPIGTGSEIIPEDTSAIADAAGADATSGTLERRDLSKRGTCKTQTSKFTTAVGAPDVSKMSRQDWEGLTYWQQTAMSAVTPDSYFQVPNWRSLEASAEASPYKGYTSDLTSYDTKKCAARCTATNGCTSFVIYFERNPTINLDKTSCPTSDAQTLIKCAFYGLPLTSSAATNVGQYTGKDFYTSIAGSNAYTTVPPNPDGFDRIDLGVATIQAPAGSDTYMGIQTFPGVSFAPQACADACNEKTAFNQRQAARKGQSTFRTCRFFDAYVAYKNGADPMFTCTYFTQKYGLEAATNIDQYNKAGDHFTHGSSYGYSLRSAK